jgi:CheY-like chemotaxis protein
VDYTILIVDDDDLNREVMEAYLSLDGHYVLITGSGHKALAMTESKLPDLIILDVRLPDLNGIEVCKSLKLNPQTKHIPVMMITGLSDRDTRQQAEDAKVDLFFPRPFDGDDFMAEVKRLLSSPS